MNRTRSDSEHGVVGRQWVQKVRIYGTNAPLSREMQQILSHQDLYIILMHGKCFGHLVQGFPLEELKKKMNDWRSLHYDTNDPIFLAAAGLYARDYRRNHPLIIFREALSGLLRTEN